MFRYFFILSGLILLINQTPAHAQREGIDSLVRALPVAHDTNKAYINYLLGKRYLRISGDSSKYYATQAIQHAKKHKQRKVLAESYSILGANEKYQGNYEEAIRYHLEAMRIKESNKDENGLCITYNDIGIVYKNMKRFEEALKFYLKSNELARKLGMGTAISFTYNNLGTVYNEIGKYDSAMLNYNLALEQAEKINDAGAIATALANLADIHFAHERYDSALYNFKRCLAFDKANEDKYGMALSHMQLGRTYSALNKLKEAKAHIDTADNIAEENNLLRERIDILMIKSSIQEQLKDYSGAILTIRASAALKDSLLNEETSKQVSELQTKYETEKKEQQIALQQSELKSKNYVIAGISGVLLLGGLLSYSYYRRYRLVQQARLQQAILQEQEQATRAVLEAEEKERQRIAGDLHDGVGQLMSAARMNLSLLENELNFEDDKKKSAFNKALSLVDDSCREVRAVSHNIMPNALLKAGLISAIREFIQKIDQRALEVTLYTDGINERLPSAVESVLYRVIQECVNNVIKHSHANKLDMTLIKDDEGISITIEDNGKGFDTRTSSEGIGLQNMQTRIHYLKGNIEWDSAPGKGTVVTIQVPLTDAG